MSGFGGGLPAATAAAVKAAASTSAAVSPGRFGDHPRAIKARCRWDSATNTVAEAVNVSSLTDHGGGEWTVNLTTALAAAGVPVAMAENVGLRVALAEANADSSVKIVTRQGDGNRADPTAVHFVLFGRAS